MLLISYSIHACQQIEAMLERNGTSSATVDGRAPDAAEAVRKSGASVVILDASARDVNVAQAIRQLGQLLPQSTVLTVCPNEERIGVYRDGRKVSEATSLGAALSLKSAGEQ